LIEEEYSKREKLLIAQLKDAQKEAEHWKERWATREFKFEKLRESIRDVMFQVGDWQEEPEDD